MGLLVQESDLVVTRISQQAALYGHIIQSAVSAAPNGLVSGPVQQKMMDGFSKLMTRLSGG